jgi:predicted small lipoprotein YifL
MSLHFTLPSRTAALSVLLAALALAGCGSSHPSHAPQAANTASGATATATGRASSTKSSTSNKPVSPVPSANPAPAPGCPKGVVPCVTKSISVKPAGPSNIDLNLEQSIVRSQSRLKHPKVTCPAAHSYPISCSVTGVATIHGKRGPIKGTITVIGVETSTRTYAYATEYAPAKG